MTISRSLYRDSYLVRKDFEKIADGVAEVKHSGVRSSRGLLLREGVLQSWQALLSQAETSGDREICLEEWPVYYDDVLGDRAQYRGCQFRREFYVWTRLNIVYGCLNELSLQPASG